MGAFMLAAVATFHSTESRPFTPFTMPARTITTKPVLSGLGGITSHIIAAKPTNSILGHTAVTDTGAIGGAPDAAKMSAVQTPLLWFFAVLVVVTAVGFFLRR